MSINLSEIFFLQVRHYTSISTTKPDFVNCLTKACVNEKEIYKKKMEQLYQERKEKDITTTQLQLKPDVIYDECLKYISTVDFNRNISEGKIDCYFCGIPIDKGEYHETCFQETLSFKPKLFTEILNEKIIKELQDNYTFTLKPEYITHIVDQEYEGERVIEIPDHDPITGVIKGIDIYELIKANDLKTGIFEQLLYKKIRSKAKNSFAIPIEEFQQLSNIFAPTITREMINYEIDANTTYIKLTDDWYIDINPDTRSVWETREAWNARNVNDD